LSPWVFHKDSFDDMLLMILMIVRFIDKAMKIQILFYPKFFLFDFLWFLRIFYICFLLSLVEIIQRKGV
jgi:hypothetical protein